MKPHILLAIRPSERQFFELVLTNEYAIEWLQSLDDVLALVNEQWPQVALVDEDFDGPDTGWSLVKMIRETHAEMKVILLTRGDYYQVYDLHSGLTQKVDWIMHYPISDVQVLSEIRRRLA